ncbi:MAG: phenylalanine--tRNA ligase subunit beta, partial [Deltaproteobacteria bacterium]|nr:phenylalanine--tRNA ligase subunit beta [Deltaproteobacteria bacterium]
HEQCCGYFGEAHPKLLELFDLSGPVFVFHLELEKFLQGNVLPRFQELSRFPFVERDLSFLVDENISAKDMLESIRRIAPALMKNVAVFDVYKGKGMVPGKKSLALRVTYASDERTLDHEEVEKTHHMVVSALEKAFHIEVRK